MLDRFTALLTVFCLAVAFVEFLIGEDGRARLNERLIKWRDYLAEVKLPGLPRAELKFALGPLRFLAGWPTEAKRWRTWTCPLLWVVILEILIVARTGSLQSLSAHLAAFIVAPSSAVAAMVTYELTRRLYVLTEGHRRQGLIVLSSLAVALAIALIAGAWLSNLVYSAMWWLRTWLGHDLGHPLRALTEAVARFDQSMATIQWAGLPSYSLPWEALRFWPGVGLAQENIPGQGETYTWPSIIALWASSFSIWVRIGSLAFFVMVWAVTPLTLRFAFLNLRSLLELQRPKLTAAAVGLSAGAKAIQALVQSMG